MGTTTERPKWSRFEKIGRHVDLCVNEQPIFKNNSGSYPWINILHAWLKICRKSSILPIRLPKIKNNRNRNVKYKSWVSQRFLCRPMAFFFTCWSRGSHGSCKSKKKLSDGRGILDYHWVMFAVNYTIDPLVFYLKKNRMARRLSPFDKNNMAPCIADVPFFISSNGP